MDPKALAKSKRSHTQHHSKKSHHPNQKLKLPSSGNVEPGNPKKPSGKQLGGQQQIHKSKATASLPSNWDRYEDEFDAISENQSREGKDTATADAELPKSKGADYHFLISEAQAQPHSNAYLEPFASFGDVFPDFNQGVVSMLSSRGQSILSWIEDDNFIVDDRETPSHEVPFLSLNLNTLAEQLAKVDLSQRLFIEPDLLPSVLSTEASEASSNRDSEQRKTTCSSEATTGTIELTFTNSSEEGKTTDQNNEALLSAGTSSGFSVLTSSTQLKSLNQTVDFSQCLETGQSSRHEPKEQFTWNSVADAYNRKPHVFEGSAAEAELDMLLDSFHQTMVLVSHGSGQKPSNSFAVPGGTLAALPQISRSGPDLPEPDSDTASIDNAIDDLLEETADSIDQKGASRLREATPPLSNFNVKSKVLDDFDSWLDTI